MSVEAPKIVEETPSVKPVQTVPEPASTVAATETPVVAEGVAPVHDATTVAPVNSTLPAEETVEASEVTPVAATPAAEGVLGYKAPGFLRQFVYSKHFFWFSEEPATHESLSAFIRNEKPEHAHHHAAWAQESGKGVLYYTKRAEDKTAPTGLILLSEATNVVKEGTIEFSFHIGKKHHQFQAATTAERDSWLVAIEKAVEESSAIKDEVVGRDSYKKTLESYAKSSPLGASAARTERSASKGPKKALDPTTPTVATTEPVTKRETGSVSSSDKEQQKAEKTAKKERSQSRKRASIFGMLGKKEEDKDVKKEEKAEKKAEHEHEKEVKKAEKEHIKEEKKAEAEVKKEEAQATHDVSKAVEAAEAAAVAAVPAAVIASDKKEEEKTSEIVTPTEKKNKRASVFGSLFGKKGVTSPSTEKTESQAVTAAPTATSEIPPVSETAPKLDEPIENKPIDTAAVTAPADVVEAPVAATTVAPTEESVKDTHVPATETTTTPKTEKKGGFLGFIKKAEAKKEHKEETKIEQPAVEPVASESLPVAAVDGTNEAVVDAPATEVTNTERPAREKRRSSFFGSLGTIKKKNNAETTETDSKPAEIKRERSPLPAKIGGLFRKPSKATKPTETKETVATGETTGLKTDAAIAGETPANATIVEPTESKIVGDVVPEDLHTTVHDAVTSAPAEVKASA